MSIEFQIVVIPNNKMTIFIAMKPSVDLKKNQKKKPYGFKMGHVLTAMLLTDPV